MMEQGGGQPPDRPGPGSSGPPGSSPPSGPPESSQPPPSQPPKPPGGQGESTVEKLRRPKVAAAIGIAVAAVIILVLVLSGGDDGDGDSGAEPATSSDPQEASFDDLRELAASTDHPIFWTGEQDGKVYELTAAGDRTYIRYLDPDDEIGTDEVAAFTVGTYVVPDAYAALQKIAKQPGALTGKTPDGGFVVSNESNPQSVYVAYPGTDYQIEIFDPNPKVAFETATSGALEPVQ